MTDRSVASRYWSQPRAGVTIVMRGRVERDCGVIDKFYDLFTIRELSREGKRSMLWHSRRTACSLEHRPSLHGPLARQRKPRLFRHSAKNPLRHIFAHRRPVLEPVSRSAAYKPDVLDLRVPVNQEISIPSIFVLANARLHDRRAPQCRKPPLDKSPRFIRAFFARQPRLRIWVDAFSVPVHRNFQSATLQVRHPVNLVLLKQPRRQCRWSKTRIP